MYSSADSPLVPKTLGRRPGERRAIPSDPSPERSLERLPKADFEPLVRFLGLEMWRPKDALVRALARELRDPARVRAVLVRAGERTAFAFLADLVLRGRIRLEALPGEVLRELVFIEGPPPPDPIGVDALHQLGLIHVGRWRQGYATYVPDDLRRPYAQALLALRFAALDDGTRRALADLVRAMPPPCAPWAPGLPTGRGRRRLPTPGPDRVLELRVWLAELESPVERRILVSYQRSLGALHEILRIAFCWPQRAPHWFFHPRRRAVYAPPGRRQGGRPTNDEWKTSIRDVLASPGANVVYVIDRPTHWPHHVETVAMHAPCMVPGEPFVLEAEGARPPPDYDYRRGYNLCIREWRRGKRPEALLEHVGLDFDPDGPVDLEAINRRLATFG